MYSGYRIAFDGAGSWSFGNDFAGNVVIFGIDNSSSSHSDNCKNNFLILDERDTFGINGSFGALATNQESKQIWTGQNKFEQANFDHWYQSLISGRDTRY